MSILDKASLIQIPSGYKSTKLYSLRPSNGDGDFTFARSSSATRVNSEGLIEEVPYNFLQQSNTFNTSWSNSGTTETSGQSGYDGSNNAWLLEKSQSNGYIYQNISQSSTQTISVYAKSGSIGGIEIYINAGTTRFQKYNLDNGTLIGTGDNESSSIEDVGGGWYRCIVTINDSATRIRLYPTTNTGDKSGTSGNIYIQNAQLVKGTSAKTYLQTTDRLNVPRLDYSGGASCASLLLEGQRTNLFQRSEEFSNAYWSTSRIETPYIADVVSPDGTLNAYTLEISSGETNGGGVYRSGISITGDNSFSVFAKKKNANYLVLADTSTTTNAVYFDLENGTVGTTYNATGEIQDFGNGWYRCTMKYTLTSSGIKFIYLSNLDGATSGGVQGGDSIYIYGAQLEQGSYPTSYIPSNSGSSTTRTADVCNNAGTSATFNDSEGVLFAEISAASKTSSNYDGISISDGSASNKVQLYFTPTSNQLYYLVVSSSSNQAVGFVNLNDATQFNKVAIKYKNNDFAFWVNGFELLTDTSGVAPIGLNTLNFDSGTGSNRFQGKTKQLMYFDEALSDEELSDLTGQVNLSFNNLATFYGYTIL